MKAIFKIHSSVIQKKIESGEDANQYISKFLGLYGTLQNDVDRIEHTYTLNELVLNKRFIKARALNLDAARINSDLDYINQLLEFFKNQKYVDERQYKIILAETANIFSTFTRNYLKHIETLAMTEVVALLPKYENLVSSMLTIIEEKTLDIVKEYPNHLIDEDRVFMSFIAIDCMLVANKIRIKAGQSEIDFEYVINLIFLENQNLSDKLTDLYQRIKSFPNTTEKWPGMLNFFTENYPLPEKSRKLFEVIGNIIPNSENEYSVFASQNLPDISAEIQAEKKSISELMTSKIEVAKKAQSLAVHYGMYTLNTAGHIFAGKPEILETDFSRIKSEKTSFDILLEFIIKDIPLYGAISFPKNFTIFHSEYKKLKNPITFNQALGVLIICDKYKEFIGLNESHIANIAIAKFQVEKLREAAFKIIFNDQNFSLSFIITVPQEMFSVESKVRIYQHFLEINKGKNKSFEDMVRNIFFLKAYTQLEDFNKDNIELLLLPILDNINENIKLQKDKKLNKDQLVCLSEVVTISNIIGRDYPIVAAKINQKLQSIIHVMDNIIKARTVNAEAFEFGIRNLNVTDPKYETKLLDLMYSFADTLNREFREILLPEGKSSTAKQKKAKTPVKKKLVVVEPIGAPKADKVAEKKKAEEAAKEAERKAQSERDRLANLEKIRKEQERKDAENRLLEEKAIERARKKEEKKQQKETAPRVVAVEEVVPIATLVATQFTGSVTTPFITLVLIRRSSQEYEIAYQNFHAQVVSTYQSQGKPSKELALKNCSEIRQWLERELAGIEFAQNPELANAEFNFNVRLYKNAMDLVKLGDQTAVSILNPCLSRVIANFAGESRKNTIDGELFQDTYRVAIGYLDHVARNIETEANLKNLEVVYDYLKWVSEAALTSNSSLLASTSQERIGNLKCSNYLCEIAKYQQANCEDDKEQKKIHTARAKKAIANIYYDESFQDNFRNYTSIKSIFEAILGIVSNPQLSKNVGVDINTR